MHIDRCLYPQKLGQSNMVNAEVISMSENVASKDKCQNLQSDP